MTGPLSKKFARAYSAETDRLVSAHAPTEEGGFAPVIFKSSRIDMLVGLGEGLSALRLDDGVTLPVALPLEDLKKRIYGDDFKDGGDIDLMAVTGEAAAEARRVKLSRGFNPAAEAGAETEAEKGIEITAFAHKEANDRKFQLVRFNTANMVHFELHVHRPQKEIFVRMASGHAASGFESFYLALPLTNFMWHLEEAKKGGRASVNLLEATRPRDVKGLEV